MGVCGLPHEQKDVPYYQEMEEILPGCYAASLDFWEPLVSNSNMCVYLSAHIKVYLDINSEAISSH